MTINEIINEYQGQLFAYVYSISKNREDAEDILQNTFIKAYQNMDKYDNSRKLSSWIYTIAHNESINYLNKKSNRRFVSLDCIDEPFIEPVVEVENKKIKEAVNNLPEKYRNVLWSKYFEDKSYEEMRDIFDAPINTLRTIIFRAKKILATNLQI